MRPLSFVLLVMLCHCRPITADEKVSIGDNDPRFQLLQPVESGFKSQAMPAGAQLAKLAFWQHRIGTDDTPALLIATSQDGERVWVNAQRDDSWTEVKLSESKNKSGDSKPSHSKQWHGTIKAQTAASRAPLWPTPESIPIVLRRETSTGLWMIASLVELSGQLEINGRATGYRLRDENSDGKLEGVDDNLQIDLDSNGQFDKLRESFPLTKFFRYQGTRYALKLDRTMRTVGVQSVAATGTVQLTFDGWEELEQPPTRIHVALQSDSGLQAVFSDTQPQTLPPGEYCVYSAVLNWEGDEKWRMSFARWDSPVKKKFHVEANQATSIPVLGKAELMAEVEGYKYLNNRWQTTIQPILKTETGLYLTRSSSGSHAASVDGTLVATVLSAADERVLTTGATQFGCGTFCPISMKWKDETASRIKLTFDSGPLAGVMTSHVKLGNP